MEETFSTEVFVAELSRHAELKARGKDNYKKNQRGPNIGEPAAEVNELMLRNMLKDANDGNDIVVLKSTSAGGSWKTRGAGPNST